MKTIDTLFGQNWIDQFQANIRTYPLPGCASFDEAVEVLSWLAHVGKRCSMFNVIHIAFCWRDTPQHPDNRVNGVWEDRQMFNYDRDSHLSR